MALLGTETFQTRRKTMVLRHQQSSLAFNPIQKAKCVILLICRNRELRSVDSANAFDLYIGVDNVK